MGLEDIVTPGELETKFEVGKVIGQGAYSTVRLGKEKATGKQVAIKYIEKRRAFMDMNLEQECRLLRQLGRHPNINAFLGLYENKKYYMIVLEYMKGGELLDILIRRVESGQLNYTEAQVAVILRQIVAAVDHCHRHGIIHRDLKPENVLVSDEKSLGTLNSMTDAPLKVADFGLAVPIQPGQKLKETCGTPNYMAPERLCRRPYDEKSDIWSIGVLMYILVAGTFPFYGETDEEIRLCTMNPKEPEFGAEFEGISPQCITLLRDQLLAKDPRNRPTASELLQHPWMTGEAASTAQIKNGLHQLKRFNARRKFRIGVQALIASNRLKAVMDSFRTEKLLTELGEYNIEIPNLLSMHKEFQKRSGGKFLVGRDDFMDVVNNVLNLPNNSLAIELYDAFKEANGSETVNTREFCLGLASKTCGNEDEVLEMAFELFDADHSGEIDETEYADMIRSILKTLGDHRPPNDLWLHQEFEAADTDGNGNISKEEFVHAAKENVKIQEYLRRLGKMLKGRNQVFEKNLQEKLNKKSGQLFVKHMSGSVVSVLKGQNLWKSRWAVVDGSKLAVYRTESDAAANKDARHTFTLDTCKITPVMETESGDKGGRVVPRLLIDGGRSVGKWMIQTKNQQELKVWQTIFENAGAQRV